MHIEQIIRRIAVVCLLVASLSVISMASQKVCLYGYLFTNNIQNFNDFLNNTTDSPTLFNVSGVLGVLFFLPFLLSSKKLSYCILLCVFYGTQWIVLSVIKSNSIIKIIIESVQYCQNYWLLTWAIGHILFIVLSLIFIFYEKRN